MGGGTFAFWCARRRGESSPSVPSVDADAASGAARSGLLREVVSLPAYRRWSVTTQLVRLPITMSPLAFLLLATAATGNYRVGGVMIAAATTVEVLLATPAGRLLDRSDPRVALSWMLLAGAVVLGLLAAAGTLSWPALSLVGLAMLSAAVTAGAPAGMRKILTGTVPARLLTPALAVDGVLIEVTIVIGPLLVAAFATLADIGGVGAMAVLTAAAALLVRGLAPISPPVRRGPEQPVEQRPPLWSAQFVLWLGFGLVAAQSIGLAEVCALPIAQRLGGGTFTAVLLQIVLCAGSAASGLTYGAYSHRLPGRPTQRAMVLLLGLASGLTVLATQDGWRWTVAGYLIVGLCTAPLVTTVLITVQVLAPAPRVTEAFGLNTATTGAGFALAGAALAALPLHMALATGLVTITASLAAGLIYGLRNPN